MNKYQAIHDALESVAINNNFQSKHVEFEQRLNSNGYVVISANDLHSLRQYEVIARND